MGPVRECTGIDMPSERASRYTKRVMRAPITHPSTLPRPDIRRGIRPIRSIATPMRIAARAHSGRCTPLARGRDGLITGARRRGRRGGDGSSRPRKSGARARSCSSRSSRSRRSSSELSDRSAMRPSSRAAPPSFLAGATSANGACASALCGSRETACSRVRLSESPASALRASATPAQLALVFLLHGTPGLPRQTRPRRRNGMEAQYAVAARTRSPVRHYLLSFMPSEGLSDQRRDCRAHHIAQ